MENEMMPPEAEMAEAPAPEESEDSVVDQIGVLLQKLSPEKQAEVIAQLSAMLNGGEEGAVSPEGGAMGRPASPAGV